MHPEFRALWNAAGYGTKMGSSEVVPPPSHEFIRVYHLTSAEFAVSDLALGRLKVARFSDLNDPYELLSLNSRIKSIRDLGKRFKEDFDRENGLLCFSGDWTSPALWSHYGSRLTGVCLGFNLLRERCRVVNYEKARILADLADEDPSGFSAETREQLMCTKYQHWEYEQERRIFVPLTSTVKEGRHHFYPFDDSLALSEVILGPECVLTLEAIRDLVEAKYHQAVTFSSRLAWGSFNVVPKESTVP
jgi:hypothetical protein